MSRDLGDECRGRATGARAVAMARGEVVADRCFERDAVCKIVLVPLPAPLQGVDQHSAYQILLGGEMRVEGAVGQARLRHDAGEADRRDTALAELRRGDIDDVPPRRVPVSLVVARQSRLLRDPGYKIVRPRPLHYDHNNTLWA